MTSAAVILRRLRFAALGILAAGGALGLALLPVRAEEFRPPPEAATGLQAKAAVEAKSFMVVAGHPLAAAAGAAMIRQGGTAVDAAVAAQMVLGLVEPESSGIGGGAFALYWDHASGDMVALDGRETAPEAIKPDTFLDASGQPLPFYDAVIGGRSVGTPGALRLWHEAHQKYGKLPWAKLLEPAITLADKGFDVSPRLAQLIAADQERLSRDPVAKAYFFTAEGKPLPVGTHLTNPAYAATLRRIAAEGADAFYTGSIAKDIVAKVHGYAANPGVLSESDLQNYTIRQREATCSAYRAYMICGVPPPASGGVTVGQILGILGHFDMSRVPQMSVDAVHLFAEASKLAYADRDVYIADPEFSPVPTAGLTDPLYLLVRAQLINRDQALPVPVRAGNPSWRDARDYAPGPSYELPSTSQITIVDKAGNVLSSTTSIEDGFGSRLMVDGFLLNNQLTDFSFRPEVNGRMVANRIEPLKRPRSAMSPTVVLDENGKPVLAVGSPGGSRIIEYVAEVLVGVLDWGLDIQSAINLPHISNRNGVTELEAGTSLVGLKPALEAMGHTVQVLDINSGVHGIQIGDGVLTGGADPRREGVAIGD